jgi:hypothetical protein
MERSHHYVLIVANRTATAPTLIDRVRERTLRSPCRFTLLVPGAPEDEARGTLEEAVPLLEGAAEAPVEGLVGPADAVEAAGAALDRLHFDEVIVSTLPESESKWLERDVAGRIERPGVPVAVVTAKAA